MAPAAEPDPGVLGRTQTQCNNRTGRISSTGWFRQDLQAAPEVPRCGGGPDVARVGERGMSQHRFKETAFAYGSQSW